MQQMDHRSTPLLLVVLLLMVLNLLVIYINFPTHRRRVCPPFGGKDTYIADYVLPENDTTLLEPSNICRGGGQKAFVLIVVASSVENFAARQTIRSTWGNVSEFNYSAFSQLHSHLKGQYLEPTQQRLEYFSELLQQNLSDNSVATMTLPVRIVFLLGRSTNESLWGIEAMANLVRIEALLYDDVIQENFIDTYHNLTLKSVMALKWVTRRCLQQSAFYMKCDDDTFVNIPNLLHFLLGGTLPLYNETLLRYDMCNYKVLSTSNRLNSTTNFMAGYLICTGHPRRNVSNKWHMPSYMFPDAKYPYFLSGGAGYLMSMDVVPRLYEMALTTTYVYLEDVFLTGVCAEKMGVRRKNHPVFSNMYSKELCSFKGSITQHWLTDDIMVKAYAFVINMSNSCPPPGTVFLRNRLRNNKDN